MNSFPPVSGPLLAAEARSAIGIEVSRRADRITAVRLSARGRGLAMRVAREADAETKIPDEVQRLAGTFCGRDDPAPATRLPLLAAHLAELEAELVTRVRAGGSEADLLAVGVHDPGLWQPPAAAGGYLGLSDAARLAESTGLTVIDAFPARHLAQGGGGPLLPLAHWLLLRDAKKPRVLVELGPTLHVTYLPPGCDGLAAQRVVALQVCPGTDLLDRLVESFFEGGPGSDAGGRLAVQGQVSPRLLERFRGAPWFARPDPTWEPTGVDATWWHDEAVSQAPALGLSGGDVLCTATHLLAESAASAVAERVPKTPPLQEILFAGRGATNGFLVGQIANRLCDLKWIDTGALGLGSGLLDAAAVGALALLHLDQVPATGGLATSRGSPRILGRLTPGGPQNWQRVLKHLAGAQPARMSLRAAI